MDAENKFGRISEVKLETEYRDGKVILSDLYFTAPFKIMQPFYPRPDYMQVMVLSASAGIMEGDVQEFSLHIKEGTQMEYLQCHLARCSIFCSGNRMMPQNRDIYSCTV